MGLSGVNGGHFDLLEQLHSIGGVNGGPFSPPGSTLFYRSELDERWVLINALCFYKGPIKIL